MKFSRGSAPHGQKQRIVLAVLRSVAQANEVSIERRPTMLPGDGCLVAKVWIA